MCIRDRSLSGTVRAYPSCMTLPRPFSPDRIEMITRRTLRQTHLFHPDPRLTEFYLYSLAVYSERYDIDIHAVVLMSTHEHLIVTDKYGRIPDFLRDFHRVVALGTKILSRWEGTVWDSEPTSRVELCTPKAIVEKLAYIMANPVEAGLVDRAQDWPGVIVLPDDLGTKTWTVERPDFFFDSDNPLCPKTATLRLTLPKTHLSSDEVRSRVAIELKQLEAEAQQRVRAKGWRVLGRLGVKKASPYRRAKSWEPLRGLNPNFAVGRGQKTAFFRAVEALRTFRKKYRDALREWQKGIRDVLFPPHTWQMCWLHRVQVEPG